MIETENSREILSAALSAHVSELRLFWRETGLSCRWVVPDGEDCYVDTEAIKYLMEYLNQREKNIITKYYGLDGNKPKTLEEIGMEYGLTKERIRQIKNTSFKKMRSVALATGMTANVF